MKRISLAYEGGLRCRSVNETGDEILTDGPRAAGGMGEALSPTEMVVFALGSCMLTMMGFAAQKEGIELKGTTVEGDEEMASLPVRRLGKIILSFDMCQGIPVPKRNILQDAAASCPVRKSLNPDIQIQSSFKYPD